MITMRSLAPAVLLACMPSAIAAPKPSAGGAASTEAVIAATPCVSALAGTAEEPQPAMVRDCADTPALITVPAGRFIMGDSIGSGSAYETPVHEVRIPSFLIGRFETTRAEWAACESAGGCSAARDVEPDSRMPVTGVTWNQAQDYLTWISRRTGHRYRLPSEAEWEYAGRAGSVSQYTWGNSIDDVVCRHANAFDRAGHEANPQWYWQADCDDGFAKLAPVGRFPPNAWGLFDMLGNVWEWVDDCWHSDYTGAPTDGRSWVEPGCRKRVNRGGGWGNPATSLRLTNRDGDPANARSDGLGFRVARDLAP